MIRSTTPKTYHDTDSDSMPSNDYSTSTRIKSSTPRIYRLRPSQQTSTIISRPSFDSDKNRIKGFTLTPSKYRLKTIHSSLNEIDQDEHESLENSDENKTIVIGDFILKKNPNHDRSVYCYKPKRLQLIQTNKDTSENSEVQRNSYDSNQFSMEQQNRSLSLDSMPQDGFNSNRSTHISDEEFQLAFKPSSLLIRSLTENNLNNFKSEIYTTTNHSIEFDDRYYFGQQTDYNPMDDNELNTGFDHDVHSKSIEYHQTIQLPKTTNFTRDVNEHSVKVQFQEVIDVGTSIDTTLIEDEPNQMTSVLSNESFNNRESILTNQSIRSESETYRVHQETKKKENDRVSSVPTNHSYINLKKPMETKLDSVTTIQTSSKLSQITNLDNEPYPLEIHNLRRKKPPINPETYEYENVMTNTTYRSNISEKSIESHKSRRRFFDFIFPSRKKNGARPPTVNTQKVDGTHKIPTTFPPRRPSSTPTTEFEDAFIEPRPDFRPGKRFPNTPRPKPSKRHGGDNDDDYDSIPDKSDHNRKTTVDVNRAKLVDESTQSEEKTTRNVGTMHDPIETRNFGNEVQPQSSSTQTSFSSTKKPSKAMYTFIERPEPMEPAYEEFYPDQRIPIRPQPSVRKEYPTVRREIRDYVYDGHYNPYVDTEYDDQPEYNTNVRENYRPSSKSPSRARSPNTSYPACIIRIHDRPIITSTHRSRTSSPPQRRSHRSSPQHRPHTPSQSIRYPSPSSRRPRSATPRHRPPMHSQETDTSLDAMRRKHHAAVQYEPRSTQEKGTTPSLRIRTPTTRHRSPVVDSLIYSQQKYPTVHKEYDRTRKPYFVHQEPYVRQKYYDDDDDDDDGVVVVGGSGEEYDVNGDEDDTPSMHDQSTMAELLVYLDHYTQCESQPFMADRYIQTTPTVNDDDERGTIFDYGDESFIRQLPRTGSISIPQPTINQPDTLPRRRQPSPTRPIRDGLDYTGNILELSLHHGQIQRTTSIRDSPLLNIGTENILNQPVAHEYAIPFETRFIYESDSSSTLRSRANGSVVAPVLNTARTHIFTRSPPRQSRSNGNFYLSTAPPRSTNSSFRIDITAENS